MQAGRAEIFTDVMEITKENVIDVLQEAMQIHEQNADNMDFLIRYEAGEQEIEREKVYRSDIDCKCVDNVANEITEFNEGFHWGCPITLVQNGENVENTKGIAELNEQFALGNGRKKEQQIARFTEITGIALEYIDLNDEWEDGENYFTAVALDPRLAFIVKSNYYFDQRKMMGVTYRTDSEGNQYFTCITKTRRYEIVNEAIIEKGKEVGRNWYHSSKSDQLNPFGLINMVEWERSCDRMGCFERQISEMNNLNLLISDFTNDVDQNTQAIWHGNDIDFPKDESGNEIRPKTNDWICTYTAPNGKQPFVKPLAVEYDYKGMLENILSRRALILQKCHIPQRNDNSGGSTGIAMSDATGWSDAEMAAAKQQPLQETGKMEETRIALAVIKKSPHVPEDSPLLKLRRRDMKPNISRQKDYEMTTKINAFATGVSHGIDGGVMLDTINLFPDPNDVWNRSRKMIEAYQLSIIKNDTAQGEGGEGETKPNSGRLNQDPSDQIDNSPRIETERTSTN